MSHGSPSKKPLSVIIEDLQIMNALKNGESHSWSRYSFVWTIDFSFWDREFFYYVHFCLFNCKLEPIFWKIYKNGPQYFAEYFHDLWQTVFNKELVNLRLNCALCMRIEYQPNHNFFLWIISERKHWNFIFLFSDWL